MRDDCSWGASIHLLNFTIRRFLMITYFSSRTLPKDDDNASEDMSWSLKETQKGSPWESEINLSSGSSGRASEVKLEKSMKRSRETKIERDPYTLAMLGLIFVAMLYKSFIRLRCLVLVREDQPACFLRWLATLLQRIGIRSLVSDYHWVVSR